FQPGPFLTCFQRISQYHARSALVWLDVWRLHRGFFSCPRIYLWGRKTASNACLGLGDCRFPHTQFDWIHPLFSVPRASPWALQFLWQAYSRGRSILPTLRMLAGFQYGTRRQLTLARRGMKASFARRRRINSSHKTEDGMKRERALRVVVVVVGLLYS